MLQTITKGDFVLYYWPGSNPEEDFVAQYQLSTSKLSNHWETISIDVKKTGAPTLDVVEKLLAFEQSIIDDLV